MTVVYGAAPINESASEDPSVKEDGGVAHGTAVDSSARRTLTVNDVPYTTLFRSAVDAKALAGAYGDFTFDSASGKWTYTLDQAKADPLTDGQKVTDTLTVHSGYGAHT